MRNNLFKKGVHIFLYTNVLPLPTCTQVVEHPVGSDINIDCDCYSAVTTAWTNTDQNYWTFQVNEPTVDNPTTTTSTIIFILDLSIRIKS